VVAVIAIRTKPWRSSDEAVHAAETAAVETEADVAEESETATMPSPAVETGSESVQ
jgi:hypothetical protein